MLAELTELFQRVLLRRQSVRLRHVGQMAMRHCSRGAPQGPERVDSGLSWEWLPGEAIVEAGQSLDVDLRLLHNNPSRLWEPPPSPPPAQQRFWLTEVELQDAELRAWRVEDNYSASH